MNDFFFPPDVSICQQHVKELGKIQETDFPPRSAHCIQVIIKTWTERNNRMHVYILEGVKNAYKVT